MSNEIKYLTPTGAQNIIDETKSRLNNKQNTFQKSSLPTPSANELNKIYQYIGTTTEDNINGYFYRCVLKEGVYVWEEVEQPGDVHVELTQAEYDNLTEEEKNNGTVYFVTDGGIIDENAKISKTVTGTSFSLTDAADGNIQNFIIKGRTNSSTAASVGDNGWGVIDLGTINYEVDSTNHIFTATISGIADFVENSGYMILSTKYYFDPNTNFTWASVASTENNHIYRNNSNSVLYIKDNNFTDAATFKAAVTGIKLYYPLSDVLQGTPMIGIVSKGDSGKGTSATITTGLPYCSLSNSLTDELDMLSGVVHKKCYSVTFDGSSDEEWTVCSSETTGSGSYSFWIRPFSPVAKTYTSSTVPANEFSNLTVSSVNAIYYAHEDNTICVNENQVLIRISGISTVADLKTYLASHPVTVVYELDTPYDAPLTPAEMTALTSLKTYSGTTNISCTDSPTMTVDYLLNTDNGQAAADMQVNILHNLIPYSNAGAHNAIYRGKYLGSSVSAEQWKAIESGRFDDLYIGDYWTINNVIWVIAAFDYYYKTGNTECTKHHVVIVPLSGLNNSAMHSSDSTNAGYYGSSVYTVLTNTTLPIIESAFGSAHILERKEYLTNAAVSGKATGGSWYSVKVTLMTEMNVYGSHIFGASSDGSDPIIYNYTTDKSQYPLFVFDSSLIANRLTFWLRDIVTGTTFARVDDYGRASAAKATAVDAIRPSFCICS